MKLTFIIIILILNIDIQLNAQPYSSGGSSQLYWTHRPDIADSCYEFTYINSRAMWVGGPSINHLFLGLYHWDDCDYGLPYIGLDSMSMVTHPPLADTLFLTTSVIGLKDTFCGYASPYQVGTEINNYQTTSPHRRTYVYKGLVYLPEKCNSWHFVVETLKIGSAGEGLLNLYLMNQNGFNNKSNYDSIAYRVYTNAIEASGGETAIYGACNFNNRDFENNSSVGFLSKPIYYFQTNKDVEYNPGPFDPDHDSISITLQDTIYGAQELESLQLNPPIYPRFWGAYDINGNLHSQPMTLNYWHAPLPGATGPNPLRYNTENNPFDTDSTFKINHQTGKCTFNAKSDMQPILLFKGTDYRNGKVVSETYFINQFTLINQNRPVSYLKVDTPTIQHVLIDTDGVFTSCTNLPIDIKAHIKLPSVSGGNLIVTTTADSTLPGSASCSIMGLNTDSVRLHFTWTPPSTARGLYNVFISAKDSNCAPPYNQYTQVYTWSFWIDSCKSPLELESVEANSAMMIYPNPANTEIIISSSEPIHSIQIFNLLSECVFKKEFKNTINSKIDISTFTEGMYVVMVNENERKCVSISH